MIILKIFGLIIMLFLIPFCLGLFMSQLFKGQDSIVNTMIYGYLLMLALLEVVGVPLVLLCNVGGYYIFATVFLIVLFVIAGLGAYLGRNKIKAIPSTVGKCFGKESIKSTSTEAKVYVLLIALCVFVQLAMVFVFASMDADDFYYNAQALTSQKYGTMYRVDASTGRSTYLDIRHALALFPMWQAVVSSVTGIHLAILAHKILPLVIIPLSYLLLFQISKELFPDKKEKQFLFVLLMNVWRVFGFVSYFTTETFFLLRTWQGKSFAGNFILPVIIWIFLMIYKKRENVFDVKDNRKYYLLLAISIIASGSSSSLAVMLSCVLTGLLGFLFLIREKDFKEFSRQICCCIPGVIYILVYVLAH